MNHRTLFGILAMAGMALGQSVTTLAPRMTAEDSKQLKARQGERLAVASKFLTAERSKLQVNDKTTFVQRAAALDQIGQLHVRYQQRHEGIRVTGSEVIVHLNRNDQLRGVSGEPVRGLAIDTKPSVTEKHAIDLVKLNYLPRGGEMEAETELVIYVKREAVIGGEPRMRSANLAWMVRVHSPGESPTRYYVDAHSGTILRKASTESTSGYTPATGMGRSGRFPNPTPFAMGRADNPPALTGPYRLYDPTRGNNRVLNMELKQEGNGWYGNAYWNTTTNWGGPGHFDYKTMSTYSPQGIGSGFEVALGLQRVWDLLDNVFSFHGFDGAGKGLTARVHYVKKTNEVYDNANWDDAYLNFGHQPANAEKGIIANSRTGISTVGHEAGHAMFQFALDESDFEDETAGINEGHGDIIGSLTNIYHKQGGSGSELPIEASTSWFYSRMVDPFSYESQEGHQGLAYYVPNMGQREEHTQGCAYGHAFVFLALGASPTLGSPTYSTMLPNGMVGIGVQKAAEIWHLALQGYMTKTATFASTRNAYIAAAEDLFGTNSLEVKAVRNAFFGIKVGGAAQDTANPAPSLSLPMINENEQSALVTMSATDDLGVASLELKLNGVQVRKLTGPGTKAWTGYISLEGLSLGSHTLRLTAKDAAGKTAEVVREFTLNGRNRLIKNGAFENGWNSWEKSATGLLTSSTDLAFLGSSFVMFSGAGQWIYQTVDIPASATTATLNYRLRVEGFPTVIGYESFRVEVLNGAGVALGVLANHSQFSGLGDNAAKGYKQYNHSLAGYKGQTVRIRFIAAAAMPTRFKLDNVSLVWSGPVSADLTVTPDPAEGVVSFYVSGISNIVPDQVKSVTLVINGQESPEPLLDAPYFAMYPTSMFVPNVNYTVKARIRNLSNTIVGTTGEQQFMIHPVTNLLTGPGFENSYWTAGNGAYIAIDGGGTGQYNAFTGARYAVMGGYSGVQTLVQNVYLPADADVITLGFRVRVNRAVPLPDVNDKLVALILDLNNNVLDSAAVIHGALNTFQPTNYRGYMSVKANISHLKGRTVRIQFRSISNAPNQTSFFIDSTSLVAKKLGFTQ